VDLGIGGRRAAVAAASRGLGFAAAEALAREGARVAICGRDRVGIEEAAARIGRDVVGIVADVSDAAGGARFTHEARGALGGVDILVANSGGPPAGDFAAITDVDAYARAFELSCMSTIAMCQEVVPGRCARGWGRVVAITSIAVRQPIPTLILSNTARAGLTGFLKTLAREVAAEGVTVNSVQPGFHATERIAELHGNDTAALAATVPARRIGDPADFGAVVAFCCSEAAGYLTGTAIPVDGGAYGGLQ